MKMFPDMFLPASVRDIPQYSACKGTKGMHQAEDKSVMIEQYPSASIVRCFLAHDHYRKLVKVGVTGAPYVQRVFRIIRRLWDQNNGAVGGRLEILDNLGVGFFQMSDYEVFLRDILHTDKVGSVDSLMFGVISRIPAN
jgi:hypothetical protein